MILAAMGSAAADVPEKFTNLTVLPKDLGKRELLDVMRDFSEALGVGCDHCHAKNAEGSAQDLDYASDALEPKRIARNMVTMVREINAKLPDVTGRRLPTNVRCVTCHSGVERPEGLDQILTTLAVKQGVDQAVQRYKELRQKYYGSGAYDFSPATLNGVAEKLTRLRNDLDGAIVLVKLNLEYAPDVARTHVMLGQLHVEKGDKAAAVASFERALALEPDNRWAKQALERVKAPQ
jgi:tetratricopeptide (TPR) repeat protein